jgi:threonine aldolase
MHIDGARAWNAIAFLNTDIKTYLQDADLVSICMSKGIGAPVGSVLIGEKSLMKKARSLQKISGGGMR